MTLGLVVSSRVEVVICVEQAVGLVGTREHRPVSLVFPERPLRQHHHGRSIVRQIADLLRPYEGKIVQHLLFQVHGYGHPYQLDVQSLVQIVTRPQARRTHLEPEAFQHHCGLPVLSLAPDHFVHLFGIVALPAPPPVVLTVHCRGHFDYVGVVVSEILLVIPLELRLLAEL